MKCGTGTPLYSAISDPTSTHKKTPKATLAYQGSYCLDLLVLGVGILLSFKAIRRPPVSCVRETLFRYHRRDLVVGRINDHELPLDHCK